jgi:hypothetical protein
MPSAPISAAEQAAVALSITRRMETASTSRLSSVTLTLSLVHGIQGPDLHARQWREGGP